jgi:hypothetical protein
MLWQLACSLQMIPERVALALLVPRGPTSRSAPRLEAR